MMGDTSETVSGKTFSCGGTAASRYGSAGLAVRMTYVTQPNNVRKDCLLRKQRRVVLDVALDPPGAEHVCCDTRANVRDYATPGDGTRRWHKADGNIEAWWDCCRASM